MNSIFLIILPSFTSEPFLKLIVSFRVNLHLEAELAAERSAAANRNVVAQNNELLALRQELQASREAEHHLNYQLDQINTAFESVSLLAVQFNYLI